MFFIASARVIKKNNIVINNPLVSKCKDMFNTMLNFFCGLSLFMLMARLKLMGCWIGLETPASFVTSDLCATGHGCGQLAGL